MTAPMIAGRVGEPIVDARGHRCPTPTLRLRRALDAVAEGAIVLLLADDPLARIDVPHFLAQAGHALLACEAQDGVWRFSVRKAALAAGAARGGRPA